ncbi:hypothetical protein LF1_20270 [Rubripirellula obstinata]|uniref:Uncharacterized protein n=1 Tax=Rubripirellula obstinata TaxID=406547 RepID=A0A5B1CJ63_9BACT|nr:hypothetical protein [Rubripirellula obstinata]KAA1259493.1 hypothetical protein LF1_20270 [Rubripirellula obstinata]
MVQLLFQSVSRYRSSLYETARNLLRSRNNQFAKVQRLQKQLGEARVEAERLKNEWQRTNDDLHEARRQLKQQQDRADQLQERTNRLPSDLPLKHHCFGPKMIALCLNLSNKIGFRPTEQALKMTFEFLGIPDKPPTWSTIRKWSCRAGVALLKEPVEAADDWIWFVDHSCQIGQDKAMQILGVRAGELPSPGETLPLEKMRPLAVSIKTRWTWDDVRKEYAQLAKRIGTPRYIVTDGAKELWETVDVLQKPDKEVIVLRDFKHYAANVFKRSIGKSDRFLAFRKQWGQTRSAIQQTELGYFTPPAQKEKARFMNLGPTLRWASMILYHLDRPGSKTRKTISESRMNEKLGWVRTYRDDIQCWSRCQSIIQTSLRLINRVGLSAGTSLRLKEELTQLKVRHSWDCSTSDAMCEELVSFALAEESKLKDDERTWISTENLESGFGQFKRLEGQHSKGGLTSLSAAMGTVLCHWTPQRVRELLPTVSTKQVDQWVTQELGSTLAAKRKLAYQEAANSSG